MHPEGKLTVIGAGPGDPELITLKAIRALERADVVLYDSLVSTELLEYAPRAEQIFVGKRKGCVAYRQPQINELIVSRCKQHKHVVRLKGGDPFVFGRGAEEMAFAASQGVEVAVVPGVSSALAVPAAQHIPVTLRGVAESFWVITGTTKEHALSADVALAARSTATVVILMGMSKLREITRIFEACGKGETPAAVIQEGTTSRERIALGTVRTLPDEVARLGLANPAVIVIGETVRNREHTLGRAVRQSVNGAPAGAVFTHPKTA